MKMGQKWINTGRNISTAFDKNPDVFVSCLVKFDSIRNTMHTVYLHMVALNVVEPLENLDYNIRVEIWNQTKDFAKGSDMDRETMIRLSKALYALEYFLNEKQ